MLTAEQYQAIGRLTIEFNDLEFAVEISIANLIGTEQWSQSLFLAEREFGFDRKCQLFIGLLKVLEDDDSSLSQGVKDIRKHIDQALLIAKKRNSCVHGMALSQTQGKKFKMRHRGEDREYDADEIKQIADEANSLFERFVEDFSDFLAAVDKARKP